MSDPVCFISSSLPFRSSLNVRRHQNPSEIAHIRPQISRLRAAASPASPPTVTVLDYGAGNVRSLENALRLFDCKIIWAEKPSDILSAEKLIFPGVGSFGAAMKNLHARDFVVPLTQFLAEDRPFLGICLGLQTLFEASEEAPDIPGLGILPGVVRRFRTNDTSSLAIPHIGWNTVMPNRKSPLLRSDRHDRFYFVHSFCVGEELIPALGDQVLAETVHGQPFVSVVQRGRAVATQFHPEKSGAAGLSLLRNFLFSDVAPSTDVGVRVAPKSRPAVEQGLAKRVVACLDVRENDAGDLVVTKGDQYDVRDADTRAVRNLGKPVALARRYFEEGADEICFLNITSFRGEPVGEAAMVEVLERTSREVFVPLCIGGGIRDYTDSAGTFYSALDVAAMYFRAGADKVCVGSDAVFAAERWWRTRKCDGTSSIERISNVYGAQAVVVSVDPRRVYVANSEETEFSTVQGTDGRIWWYQCTVRGGREARNLDAVRLAQASEALGAGEILLNSMDQDGQKNGFDLQLVRLVRAAVGIPVVASSGAGRPEHFTECFQRTDAEAALAAGIFHRGEVSIDQVKHCMAEDGMPVRRERDERGE